MGERTQETTVTKRGRLFGDGAERVVLARDRSDLGRTWPKPLPRGLRFTVAGALGVLALSPRAEPLVGHYGPVVRHLLTRCLLGGGAPLVFHGETLVYRSVYRLGPGRVRWGIAGETMVRLARGEAYVEYCETAPTWRGQGVFTSALDSTARWLFTEADVTRVWIDAEATNEPSRRAIEHAGFTEQRRLRPRKLLTAWADDALEGGR